MSNRWWTVVAAGLAVFAAQLDGTVVGVALPVMTADLGASAAQGQWVVLGYLLPLIGLSLSAGRWVGAADPRRALRLSAAGFAASSVAVAVAPGIGTMVAARVVQGVFAAVLFALSAVLATTAVAPQRRGRAMGLVMLLGTAGGMLGPVVGGLLSGTVGWPWIFLLNVPVALAVIAAGARQLPLGPPLPRPERSWLVEGATFGAAAVAVLLGLALAVDAAPGWALLALLAVPLLAAWVRAPGSAPVRAVLAVPGVAGPHLAILLTYAGLFVLTFVVPFVLQVDRGVTPVVSGLVLIGLPAAAALSGLPAGALADRVGAGRVALAGAALIAVGLGLCAVLAGVPAPWAPVPGLVLVGAGFGLFGGQVQVLAMAATPRDQLGTTAGTTGLVRQLGIALGTAGGAAVWTGGGGLVAAASVGLVAVAAVGATLVATGPAGVRTAR